MSASTTDDSEHVPVHLVAYDEDADLDVDDSGAEPIVENHDELVANGQTHGEIRMLKRSDAEEHGLDIVEPGDHLWSEEIADLDPGDAVRLDD